jgi:UPF0148 protein
MSDREKIVKRSAELLKQGAEMLSIQCPICGSPLFRLKSGDIVCPIHGKIHVVTDETQVIEEVSKDVLGKIMERVVSKLETLSSRLGDERTPREEAEYAEAFLNWLRVFELLKKLRREERESREKRE